MDKNTSQNLVGRLRIKAKAYEHKILDTSVKQIIDAVKALNLKILGPVPLPTKIAKQTVNRASFTFKDSREQFEIRTHTRVLYIEKPTQKAIESLSTLALPAGVSVEVEMVS